MKNERILVVEDELEIIEFYQDYLENSGYRVRILDRGDEAVDLVQQDPMDLILLNLCYQDYQESMYAEN